MKAIRELALVMMCAGFSCSDETNLQPAPEDGGSEAIDAEPEDADLAIADTGAAADAASARDAAEEDATVAIDADAGDSIDASLPVTRELSILDINLLHGFPTGEMLEERTQIVIDAILALQPDVVTVQEASVTSSRPNVAETIAGAVGYQWVWQRAAGFGEVFNEGPGVLSRWPITGWGYVQLEGTETSLAGRVLVRAKVQMPYGDVYVSSAHMSGPDDDQMVGADQALIAYDYINQVRGALPGFLAGDTNAQPDHLAMRFFRGETPHGGVTADLIDAWLVARPGELGFTSEAQSPNERIDYIMMLPGIGGPTRVVSCEIMFDQPVNGIYASDHLGVFCRFEL